MLTATVAIACQEARRSKLGPENPGSRTAGLDTKLHHHHEGLLLVRLKPLGMSQTDLANRIKVSFPRVNELVNGKRRTEGARARTLPPHSPLLTPHSPPRVELNTRARHMATRYMRPTNK